MKTLQKVDSWFGIMSNNLIHDVEIVQLKEIFDDKGSVFHMLRNDERQFKSFGECYFSEVNVDCIKGWKKHTLQTQNISVPIGKIKFVLFDPRKDSPTYKNILNIQLGRPDEYSRISIPPNIWYSFKCISESKALIANCTDIPHDPNESEILALESKEIPFSWG
tara:strand:- start:592 stop:1083 length:492 start_codon:yes stop_codon:yes gene_type:complete